MVCHGTSFNKSLLTDSFLDVTRIRRLRSRGYKGRGTCQGTASSQGSVRPQLPVVTPRVFLPSVICVGSDTLRSVRDTV